jgi:hypothetical protein
MINIEKNGQIIRTSKNLRGILDYARLSSPKRIELTPQATGGRLRVIFFDGASTSATFNSFDVMVDWVKNRRSWPQNAVINYAEVAP